MLAYSENLSGPFSIHQNREVVSMSEVHQKRVFVVSLDDHYEKHIRDIVWPVIQDFFLFENEHWSPPFHIRYLKFDPNAHLYGVKCLLRAHQDQGSTLSRQYQLIHSSLVRRSLEAFLPMQMWAPCCRKSKCYSWNILDPAWWMTVQCSIPSLRA